LSPRPFSQRIRILPSVVSVPYTVAVFCLGPRALNQNQHDYPETAPETQKLLETEQPISRLVECQKTLIKLRRGWSMCPFGRCTSAHLRICLHIGAVPFILCCGICNICFCPSVCRLYVFCLSSSLPLCLYVSTYLRVYWSVFLPCLLICLLCFARLSPCVSSCASACLSVYPYSQF
jgi:hypothetical protein